MLEISELQICPQTINCISKRYMPVCVNRQRVFGKLVKFALRGSTNRIISKLTK